MGDVGTKGTRLPRFIEANSALFVPGYVDGQPISNSSNADQRRLYSGCTLADLPSTCKFSSTGEIASIANSAYNALQASLRKRFSGGMSFLLSYTWSKTIDDVSSFNITGSAAKPVAGENVAEDHFGVRWDGVRLDPVQLAGLALPKTAAVPPRHTTASYR